jgi:hypothetical protein
VVGGCNYRGISEHVRRAAAGRRKWDTVKGRITRLRAPNCNLRRPPSRDIVDFYFLSFFFFVVVFIASRSTQHVLRDTRRIRTTRPNHTPFRSHCLPPLSFSLYFTSLFSHSRTLEQRLPTLSHYHAGSVCSLIHPHLSFPLYAYTLYLIPITVPTRSPLRYRSYR